MKNIVIIGTSDEHCEILETVVLEDNYQCIGYVDSFKKKDRKHNGYPVLGNELDLPYLIDKHNIYGGIVAIKDDKEKSAVVDRVLKIIPDFNFISSYLPKLGTERNLSEKGSMKAQNEFINAIKAEVHRDSPFVHRLADVQTNNIGSNTKIWQFSVILKNAQIGDNCNINSHTFIENKVLIGNNVTIKCGVYLWDGMRIENDVFIGPNVTFTNDKYPRSKSYPAEYQETIIRKGASIGANATVLGGITIGENAMIGAGSVVTKNVPEGELWVGNPARFVKKMVKEYSACCS